MPSKFITVNVTARDIKYGVPRAAEQCPIHRAISRTKFGKQFNLFVVSTCTVAFYFPLGNTCAPLPFPAEHFIRAFDRDEPVEPFTFKLKVPDTDAE